MHHFGKDGLPRYSTGEPLTSACDNVLAGRLGNVAHLMTNQTEWGDHIDRGLILLRILRENGFEVVEIQ